MTAFTLSCVLFDLDGTLVDTAPDLLACLDRALIRHGFDNPQRECVKPFISYGAAAMIKSCLDGLASAELQAEILNTMLDDYQHNIAEHSLFFDGIPDILTTLEASGIKWGVVTNKRQRFTTPLMDALQLTNRAACIISGDTAAKPKPHPEPMLAACQQADVKPVECVYIGDASHDIAAGKSVEMKTLAALYGYLKPDDEPETWGADALIASPAQLATWIEANLCR